MDIHLGYIEGISRIDTPYFANISGQEDYFDSHEVETIETTFYPPHYLNRIKVDTDDVSFNTNVNYLWFTYNTKTYYYFIEDVEYISETVIYLHCSMDVIQTYMFNIRITNGIIERKFIDRWNDNNINRNYLRENVSNNLFDTYKYTIYNDDYSKWMYFMKTTKAIDAPDGPFIDTMGDIASNVGLMDDGTLVYTLNIPYGIYFSYIGQNYNNEYFPNYIPTVGCAFPETADCYIIPFSCVNGIDIDANYNLIGNVIKSKKAFGHTDYYFFSSNIWQYIAKMYSNAINVAGLVKNTYKYRPFESSFITQLLDENYINLTFGDNTYFTEYPLHRMSKDTLYSVYWADPSTGDRYYNLTVIATQLTYNRYNTIIKNPCPLKLDLKNKPWEEYLARNKNGLMSAMISDFGTYASIAGGMALAGDSYSNNLTMMANNDKYWDKRYKTPHLKSKYKDSVIRMGNEYRSDIMSETYEAASKTSATLGYFINRDNLIHSPSTVKQTGDASQDLFNSAWAIGVRVARCNDYDVCANYFHRNGYLVNEHVNSISNIFSYVNTRYYFNVLKMSDVDLHLSNVIEDETTVDIIKDRFAHGLRLWNYTYKGYVVEVNQTTGTSQSFTYNVAFNGIYDSNSLVLETYQGGAATMNITVSGNTLTVNINVSNPGLFSIKGNVYSHDSSSIDINIGDFYYDNVEKSYF